MDDFIITGGSKELLEDEFKPLVEQFLAGTRSGGGRSIATQTRPLPGSQNDTVTGLEDGNGASLQMLAVIHTQRI